MRLEDLQGRRIGRYEIVALLGRGGMAAVYRAHDTALRRDVALKVLYPQYSDDRTLTDRFEREAVLAAGLDHPNIVPIYDVGAADGLVYIAMKLLVGPSLADVLRRRGALPLGETVAIVEQIASALDYAHARNIVHRDIKAGNILLEGEAIGSQPPHGASSNLWPWAAGPRAILTDFGIAKSLEPQASGLTGTGVLIGTPDYMAPEQIRSGQTVDYRVDIYALGILVFRCLTGRLPFEGGTEQVLMGHLYGTIPDPSMLVPSLPAAIDPIVRKALARDPAERYQHAGDLARALHAAAGLEPQTPPPARRRDLEGRAVVPNIAVEGLYQRRAAADEPTRRGDAAPAPRRGAPPLDRARERGEPSHGAFAPVLLALVLILLVAAVFGGLLFLQARSGGGTAGGVPTHTPPAAATPVQPTEPPEPTAAPAVVPTAAPSTTATAAPAAAPTAPPPTAAPPPAATATPRAQPTAQPTSTPTEQPTDTPTAQPTDTPTSTACPVTLAGGFGKLWSENQQLRERLGCPIEGEQGGPSTIAEQPFERGSMFYYDRLPNQPIYALIGVDSGRWRRFDKSELIDLPTPTPTTEPACPAPLAGGFGLVWASFPAIRDALGCSTAPEDGLLEGAYQPFQQGTMLFSQKGLGRGKTIYVLYGDQSFERYDDPNQ